MPCYLVTTTHDFNSSMETKTEISDTDPWTAPDKLYHLLFCFFLTLFFSFAASRARYLFLRRHSIAIGSIVSLFAGAAKEAADQIGIFPSAGASFRDAVADIVGVLVAAAVLWLCKRGERIEKQSSEVKALSMV